MKEPSVPINVFLSYSHEDEDLRHKLDQHLEILKRQGTISIWHDRMIAPGQERAEEINEKLEEANIILLLISASFLASEYCYGIEMKRAWERHNSSEAKIIPIILQPCYWEGAPFSKLQVLPRDAKPVTKWLNQDEAFKEIALGISEVAKDFVNKTSPDSSYTPQPQTKIDIGTVLGKMKFTFIKPGTFIMGEDNEDENERPAHEVTISKPFYIGTFVLTQWEWKSVMGTEPWKGQNFVKIGDYYPAVHVSWADAKTFIARLNSHDRDNYYRLPTEAEWEYVARAGTKTKFSFGDDDYQLNKFGWYNENTLNAGQTHPHQVGQRSPNNWGLYDIHGNIWEWVEDGYFGSYAAEPKPLPDERVLRGGGYDFSSNGARSAYRNKLSPIRSNHVIGFRLVKEPI